jgi:hypothetical protein
MIDSARLWPSIMPNGAWVGKPDPINWGKSGCKVVYDREVKTYEVPDILPRAALFYRAEVARNAGEALKRLAAPTFEISQAALLEEPRHLHSAMRAGRQCHIAASRSCGNRARRRQRSDGILNRAHSIGANGTISE